MHRRLRPRHHRFKYRVFSLLLDVSELPRLDRELRFFKWNRFGLFGFHDKDHGDGRELNAWLDGLLAGAGLQAHGARYVLCYPRILGYVFNPLSVWFCHDCDERLAAIVYEVHNTYDERHAYVLPVGQDRQEHRPGNAGRAEGEERFSVRPCDPLTVRHDCAKEFYVSPFLSRDCRYQFRVRPPGEDVAIAIHEAEAGAPILNASFAGTRTELTDGALLKMLLRYPLMTVKVVAAIHYEALRLMLKGIKRHPHTPKAALTPAE
jgi:DUF1365 family protein